MLKNLKIRTKLILLFLFSSLIPITTIVYISHVNSSDNLLREKLFHERYSLEAQKKEIISYLDHFNADLEIINDFSSFKQLINEPEASSTSTISTLKNDVSNDFLSFAEKHDFFYQIRYIDETGQEIIRIDQPDLYETPFIVPESNLQNKSDRYYFKETMALLENKLFISPLDLSVENGEIENRGTEADPIYVPVLRIATPLFNKNKEKKGILIINTYADIFLNTLNQNKEENIASGRTTMLVNKDGYFLYHHEDSLRWGFMLENDNTILKVYPTVAEEIFKSNYGQFFDKQSEYQITFERIPLLNKQKTLSSLDTSNKHIEVVDDVDKFWILFTKVEKGSLDKPIREALFKELIVSFLLILLVSFITLLFGKSITEPIKKLKEGILKIREGNLHHKIVLNTKDELGILGNSINEITEQLEKNKKTTDKKVKKRTEQLEKLNRFLIGRELKMIKLKSKLKKINKKDKDE